MRTFTKNTFRSFVGIMDEENQEDFETLIEAFVDKFDILFDDDIDEIIDYLSNQMDISCDADFVNMSSNEISKLIEFVNDVIISIYDGE